MVWVYTMRVPTGMMNNVPIGNRTFKMFESNPVDCLHHALFFSASSAFYCRAAPPPAPGMDGVDFSVFTKMRFQSVRIVERRFHPKKYPPA
jgi:hypothetical protein